jgi:hypothetical protein
MVTVELRNLSTRSIASFDAIFVTPKGLAGYEFHVPVERWQTRRVARSFVVDEDAGVPELREGPVSTCTVHSIVYSDGTTWRGPSPL